MWGRPPHASSRPGTKPEPPAQREAAPHQGAPPARGLPAPRQAAQDELDRRPRRRVLHGHRGDQVGPPAGRGGGPWAALSSSLGGRSAFTGRSVSCSRPRRPSELPAGPTSPSPCARARPCRCGPPRPRRSTTSPSSSRTRPRRPRPLRPQTSPRPPARLPARPPGFGSALPLHLQRSCSRGHAWGEVRLTYSGEPRSCSSFVLLFWPERSEEPPGAALHRGLLGGWKFCCVPLKVPF